MVDTIEKWANDSNRKYGDVELLQTDYGYHIVYYISQSTEYKLQCVSAIKAEDEQRILDTYNIKK